MKGNLRRVKKEDFPRVLLTETCPYEVPVIFSNLGFYWHVRKYKDGKSDIAGLIEYLFVGYDHTNHSIPLVYKIRKDEDSFRTLSLLHPCAQMRFVDFYKEFDEQILLECRKSIFSIRAPYKVASKYYTKNPNQNINKYRSDNVSNLSDESKQKFLPSYFSYNGYTRLYKFFDSQEFVLLEQKFSSFWSLDISKCFDSIYTHSIAWALKTKAYSKSNARVKNSFGSIFDRIMQSCNYNETAGIVIGPETSRVFAEIIFQEIDQNIELELSALGFVFGESYVVKRYVDDIFIFTTDDLDSEKIKKVVSSCFKKYKLNLNSNKTIKASRPFVTQKTKSLRLVKAALASLTDRLVSDELDQDIRRVTPKRIYNRNKLAVGFLNDVKSSYDLACGYVVSALCNLLAKVTDENIRRVFDGSFNKTKYADFFHIVIDLMFHFYTVNPNHNSSVKICMAAHFSCTFFDAHIPEESGSIRSIIYVLGSDFFKSSGFIKMKLNAGYALLESLNLLISLKGLGHRFSLPREVLSSVVDISESRDYTYFEIITLLYYIGSSDMYNKIKSKVIKSVKKKLLDLSDIRQDSEKIYLLLDMITCPYVEDSLKAVLVERLLKQVLHRQPSLEEISDSKLALGKFPWFISWTSAELMSSLEKKALLKSY